MDSWYLDAVWISVAFLGGFIVRRISLPPLIGFLLAGFCLNLFGFDHGGMALEAAANLGVMLLLFSIGLKLNIRSLLVPEIWLATSIQMAFMTALFGMVVFGLSFFGFQMISDISSEQALLIGFALSFSSTVFAIKTLEDRGEITSFHGKLSIGVLIIQDILAVAFLSIIGGISFSYWILLLPVYLFVIRYLLLKILDHLGHGELFTLFGFFTAFVAGALSFKFFGLKPDLGALVIGLLIGSHKRSEELNKQMSGYKDFFLVAFFLQIGLAGLPTFETLLITMILTLLLLVKSGTFLLIFTRFKLRARTSWLASLALSNYSEFGLIVAAIGYQEGLLGPEWLVTIAFALSISFLAGSPVNSRAHELFHRHLDNITWFNKECDHPDDEITDLGDAQYLICGMGNIGRKIYHYLHGVYGDKVIGIDYDLDNVEKLQSANKNVFYGDATDYLFWKQADLSNIKMVFIAMSDHTTNVNVAKEISLLENKTFLIGATSHFQDEFNELKQLGVHFVYNHYDRIGTEFAEKFIQYGEEKSKLEVT